MQGFPPADGFKQLGAAGRSASRNHALDSTSDCLGADHERPIRTNLWSTQCQMKCTNNNRVLDSHLVY